LTTSTIIVFAALLILLIVVIAFFLLRKRKFNTSEKLQKILEPHKLAEAKSVLVKEGLDALLEIEHVVLLKQGVLIIQTYEMDGHLFAADNIDQWTQLVNGGSFQFNNPLNSMNIARHALTTLMPKVPIFCRIVFNGSASFPKGKPEEVVIMDSIEDDINAVLSQPALAVSPKAAWKRFLSVVHQQI